MDSRVISVSKESTYYYKKDIGRAKDLVIIAVHFKNAYRGYDQSMATIDGIWQISENPMDIEINKQFCKMQIASIDLSKMKITLDNKGNTLTLNKNEDINLIDDIYVKCSNSDEMLYYIYRKLHI